MLQNYFEAHPWKIIDRHHQPKHKRFVESIFSLGNEHMGLRGFFEEDYSGDSFQGTYLAGVYYPDPTKVGWWKNGYPEFFAKVINSTNWVGLRVRLDGEALDLASGSIGDYLCELDMQQGLLTRSFTWTSPRGRQARLTFRRFLSMDDVELAVVACDVTPLQQAVQVEFVPYLDGDVKNEDSNYGQTFWDAVDAGRDSQSQFLQSRSRKTGFETLTAMQSQLLLQGVAQPLTHEGSERLHYAEARLSLEVPVGQTATLIKYVSVLTSRDHEPGQLKATALKKVQQAKEQGYERLFLKHRKVWDKKWAEADVVIEGDVTAQQGIRYNIFQLQQTYGGRDARLNIGPKGFTGEKYGSCTYWDTEAFCFPFYLYTNKDVARNLLLYRYQHLEQAKENARKLHLDGALYPMVTIDGRECHNEWEITFEEIHRNGAIAYAIYHYTAYTGDTAYLDQYGIEVLLELSRFWASRVNFSNVKQQYVILGVTGPNEYENNVNNNWYTNMLARWTLAYTLEQLDRLHSQVPARYQTLVQKTGLTPEETAKWADIRARMFLPYDASLAIPMQQEGYLDKDQKLVADLKPGDYPLHKNWSWDRILRSSYIKQADTLQGLYFFPELVDKDEMRRAFDFYEPRTVHESSLSPSIYAVMASMVGYHEKAYELYLRTARLDLDNYNHDTEDGCHITSMVGSWLSIVQGFAGLRFEHDRLSFRPNLPIRWQGFRFQLSYRGRALEVSVHRDRFELLQRSGSALEVEVLGRTYQISEHAPLRVTLH